MIQTVTKDQTQVKDDRIEKIARMNERNKKKRRNSPGLRVRGVGDQKRTRGMKMVPEEFVH